MGMRLGLGPVFAYESLAGARRWQVYAGRAAFVAVLLAGLALVWVATIGFRSSTRDIHALATAGESFFDAIATIQLTLVLLAAPGATAGAICLDRARGTLTHMMVTDLSDGEIVLGKLAARLAPVLGLVVCGLPVMALAELLGGIDPGALLLCLVVSLAVAALGCALALALSVRANRPHEVLLVVYMIFFAWLLAVPIWDLFESNIVAVNRTVSDLVWKTNPFVLVFAPYSSPGWLGAWDYAGFVAGVLAIAAGLVALTVVRLRRAVARVEGRVAADRRRSRFWARLPGPSLDGNPVLWREWHRNRPSRLARFAWWTYGLGSAIAMGVIASLIILDGPKRFEELTLWIGVEVALGLLLVVASAPTALGEERVRGSLDVLLATPLRTRAIVLGKWWGAFRPVPPLAILPALTMGTLALVVPDIPNGTLGAVPGSRLPITSLDRALAPLLTAAQVLAYGAAFVSLGLALASWFKRPGRAIAVNVTAFVLIAIAWPIFEEVILSVLDEVYSTSIRESGWEAPLMLGLLAGSPLAGPNVMASAIGYDFIGSGRARVCLIMAGWCLAALAFAGAVLLVTIATFDRLQGRVPDAARRPRPTRPRRTPPAPTREAVAVEAGG